MTQRQARMAAALLLLPAPVLAQTGGPDAFGYRYEPGVFDFVPIAAVGSDLNLDDDGEAVVALPWAFPWYGGAYATAFVGANGAIAFNGTDLDFANGCLPNAAPDAPDLAVFWDDLNPEQGGGVYTWHDVANDRFVVSWEAVPHFFDVGAATFQAHLFSDGRVLMQYLDTDFGDPSANDGVSATIGVQNHAAARTALGEAVSISCDTPAGLDGTAILVSTCADADGDGYGDAACGGGDCDDADGFVRPGALEVCNGLDDDCDPSTHETLDHDFDGLSACDGDCDDTDVDNFPTNAEVCDGADNDCSGAPDADPAGEVDADADGSLSCADCDDGVASIFPGAPEVCDGADTDCDGTVPADESVDADGDGALLCGDCDDADAAAAPGNAEVCDGFEANCASNLDAAGPGAGTPVPSALGGPQEFVLDVTGPDSVTGVEVTVELDHTYVGDVTLALRGPDGTEVTLVSGVGGDGDDFDATTFSDSALVPISAGSAPFSGSFQPASPLSVFAGSLRAGDWTLVVTDDFVASDDGVLQGWTLHFVDVDEADADGDGALVCAGDCDDADTTVGPSFTEVCDALDNDCDGSVAPFELDGDGDGWAGCLECDDFDATVHPGAFEQCNGADDDCDGTPDEDFDADGDGWPTDLVLQCVVEFGGDVDCDDNDDQVFPNAAEWCDAVDNDCDGNLVGPHANLDGDTLPDCIDPDDDNDGWPDDGDCAPMNPLISPGAFEVCDLVDDDCDGDLVAWYPNADGDSEPDCVDVDDDNDGALDALDCEPNNPTIHPGAPELCDVIDSDCDGNFVDGFPDSDGDETPDCTDPDDDNDLSTDEFDCGPTDPTIYPGAPELCDSIDSNCDGDLVDGYVNFDGDAEPDCADLDDDNDGDPDVTDCEPYDPSHFNGGFEFCDDLDSDCDGSFVDEFPDFDQDQAPDCTDPDDDQDGFPDDVDCLPLNPLAFPGGPELCDGLDTDCDGDVVDEYSDLDSDGEPDCIDEDDDGDGYADAIDCAPEDAAAYPGAPEACDAIDSDCDGDIIDEYVDADSDFLPDCIDDDTDGDGFPNSVDCAPDDASVFPNAVEACDGIDSDCDNSLVDEFDDFDGDADPDCTDLDDDGDGVLDVDEEDVGADPLSDDSDGDGLDDGFEWGDDDEPVDSDGDGDPDIVDPDDDGDGIDTADEGEADADGDGVPNYLDDDSDGDGLSDADEGDGDPDGDGVPNYLDDDSDGNGVDDADEPDGDADGDGIPDAFDADDADGPDADADGDGISNGDEVAAGTDPQDADSDDDGLDDGEEDGLGTDPLAADSDRDGMDDGTEVEVGADPLDEDTDGDGVWDGDDGLGDDDGDGEINVLDPTDDSVEPGDDDDSAAGDDDDDDDGDDDDAADDDDASDDDDATDGDDGGDNGIPEGDDDDSADDYIDAGAGCGCNSNVADSAPMGVGLLLLVGLVRRRR